MAIVELDGFMRLRGHMEPHGNGWRVIEPGEEPYTAMCWELDEGCELVVQVTGSSEAVRCTLMRDEYSWYLLDMRTLFVRDELENLTVLAMKGALKKGLISYFPMR